MRPSWQGRPHSFNKTVWLENDVHTAHDIEPGHRIPLEVTNNCQ
jgi:hypothetical protein